VIRYLEISLGIGDVVPQDGHREQLFIPLLLVPDDFKKSDSMA
jgi:hypothetical protein